MQILHLQIQHIFYIYVSTYSNDSIHSDDIDGLVQDRSNSIANALELLQSRTKPSILGYVYIVSWSSYCATYDNGNIHFTFCIVDPVCIIWSTLRPLMTWH